MATLLLVMALTAAAGAQAPPPAAPPPAAPPPAASQAESYDYSPEGRRDPFVSLLLGGTGTRGERGGSGVNGLAGMATDDISVRGVVAARGGFVAMVMGPDNKTYLVRQGDELLDGTVKTVTARGLVILQEVSDPLSLVKQKEVRKMLRGLEEGK